MSEEACRYTISRCRKGGDLYGSSHSSMDAVETSCGIKIDGENWWIISNMFTGSVTCKSCNEANKQGR